MKRILVINDYSLAKSWQDVRDGLSPNHFLYGVDYLERWGNRIVDVSLGEYPLLAALDQLAKRLPIHVGSLDRQLAALHHIGKIDLIYSPCHIKIHLLCHARALGMLQVPIVWLAHHPVERGRLAGLRRPFMAHVLSGSAAVPSLSRRVTDQLNGIAARPVAECVAWGPDPTFYPPGEYPGTGVVAAGRTGRDFVTFARAARRAGTPVTILCQRAVAEQFGEEFIAPNIQVLSPETFLEYRESARLFTSARGLAVPMLAQDSLCGLSSLMDGLGCGKPLLVTRNDYLDLDLERLGIGRWIDPGDEEGWIEALHFLDEHPLEATEMGRRARALVEAGMHAATFAERIAEIIRLVT